MKLIRARIQNYRSIIDTGEFEVEKLKTILVGPNEAGKTVILKALQQLNKPKDVNGFNILRDYPRSKYSEIKTGKVNPEKVEIVAGYFELEEEDKRLIPSEFHKCTYRYSRNLNNTGHHRLLGGPDRILFKNIRNGFSRMVAHMDKQFVSEESDTEIKKPSDSLSMITSDLTEDMEVSGEVSRSLRNWLDTYYPFIEEGNEAEEKRHTDLIKKVSFNSQYNGVLKSLSHRMPLFVLFNNYFRVKPSIHLGHLVKRVEEEILDDEYFDYGNLCLLKLLGFNAKELADLGDTPSPSMNDTEALQEYKDRLDERSYQLNAASIKLTKEIRSVWLPDAGRQEADNLKVNADGQYLKVIVEDELGVEIELDQRSEGFQWLVSFFVVFFSETMDKHKNAILLLDEPGLSLHGLKQCDFSKHNIETIKK